MRQPDAAAVVMGNRNYKDRVLSAAPVEFAHNDAKAVMDYLTQALGFSEGNVIHLQDATLSDMVKVFDSGQEIGGSSLQIEAMVLGDLEGDGDLDMLVGGQSGSIRVFRNDGTGVFSETSQTVGSNYVYSLALGDLNGDGTLDLVDGGGGGMNNRVWLNR